MTRIQPDSVPTAFSTAQPATSAAAAAPIQRAAASANGALEPASVAAGSRPLMATEAARYTKAASATPASVAMGTSLAGFRTTAAATDALSRPTNAQKISANVAGTACASGRPLTFQDSWKITGSKANQPSTATPSTGSRPMSSVPPSKSVTRRAPRKLMRVISQMMTSVQATAGIVSFRTGKKMER